MLNVWAPFHFQNKLAFCATVVSYSGKKSLQVWALGFDFYKTFLAQEIKTDNVDSPIET
jgi:hypothetical protein